MGTLLNRRRYMGGKSLPYDAEIEYLDIKKEQFINTNHIPTNDMKVRLKLYEAYAQSGVIVGYVNDTIREAWRFFYAVGSFLFRSTTLHLCCVTMFFCQIWRVPFTTYLNASRA